MLKEFPYKVKATTTASWNKSLFKANKSSKKLYEERRRFFHTFVMKCMFWWERGRRDITPGVGFMSLRVKEANEGDCNKQLRLVEFLKGTIKNVLRLEADKTQYL